MKTKLFSRGMRKVRLAVLCLAIAVMAGFEFWGGESLASRFGQATYSQPGSPPAPNMGISDLFAAAR